MADDTAEHERAGLEKRHEELERRLADLDRHLSLTTDEQVERIRLKKEKLLVKDRLQQLGVTARMSATG
jgi:uncharacterized protein YdcH (DUF465 family)